MWRISSILRSAAGRRHMLAEHDQCSAPPAVPSSRAFAPWPPRPFGSRRSRSPDRPGARYSSQFTERYCSDSRRRKAAPLILPSGRICAPPQYREIWSVSGTRSPCTACRFCRPGVNAVRTYDVHQRCHRGHPGRSNRLVGILGVRGKDHKVHIAASYELDREMPVLPLSPFRLDVAGWGKHDARIYQLWRRLQEGDEILQGFRRDGGLFGVFLLTYTWLGSPSAWRGVRRIQL